MVAIDGIRFELVERNFIPKHGKCRHADLCLGQPTTSRNSKEFRFLSCSATVAALTVLQSMYA